MNNVLDFQNTVIKQLASALQATFNIGEGFELVYVLCNGMASNNRDALEKWVTQSITTPDMEIGKMLLPTLVDRLECQLRRKEMLPW